MHALMYNRIWIDEKVTSINFAASPISSYERCVRAWPPVSLSLSVVGAVYDFVISSLLAAMVFDIYMPIYEPSARSHERRLRSRNHILRRRSIAVFQAAPRTQNSSVLQYV